MKARRGRAMRSAARPTTIDDLVSAFQAGLSIEEVAGIYGVSRIEVARAVDGVQRPESRRWLRAVPPHAPGRQPAPGRTTPAS